MVQLSRLAGKAASDFRLLQERVDTLRGDRGNKKDRAVRVADLSRLSSLSKVRSSQVTASPTQSDFNKLQQDVDDIKSLLITISNELR